MLKTKIKKSQKKTEKKRMSKKIPREEKAKEEKPKELKQAAGVPLSNPIAGVVGIPSRGMVSTHFMMARCHLGASLGISWSDLVVTHEVALEKGIDPNSVAAKKQFIAEFAVESGAEWVFFLDDDVIFPPNSLLQLLSRNKDIIGGVYWSKSSPPVPLIFRGHMQGPYMNWHVGDFLKVDAMGMGLNIIKTKVFKAMPKPWFSENYVYHNLKISNTKNIGTTEDLYFYKKAKDYGFEVWCDTTIQAQHYCSRSKTFFGLTMDMPQAIPASEIISRGKKLIADIGCGQNTPYFKEGIPVRMDIREDVNPDIVCDVRQIPEPDMKYDIVYSSNTLEHFSHRGVVKILLEWLRILKKGGELRLIVPNLAHAAKAVLDDKITDFDMWIFYGQQGYAKDFHACGFTKKTLQALLEGTQSLKDIKVSFTMEGKMLIATAKKVKHISFESISPEYSFKRGDTMKGN